MLAEKSTGDPATAAHREFASLYPVARESQKFPPKEELLLFIVVEHGNKGE